VEEHDILPSESWHGSEEEDEEEESLVLSGIKSRSPF
jgi:hypothetical protein